MFPGDEERQGAVWWPLHAVTGECHRIRGASNKITLLSVPQKSDINSESNPRVQVQPFIAPGMSSGGWTIRRELPIPKDVIIYSPKRQNSAEEALK